MTKKLLSVLLIFAVSLFLVSCNRENRFSFPELIRRLDENSEGIGVSLDDAFFSDGEWFLFVSVCSEDDILITAKENEESKFLESVTVSTLEMEDEGQREAFIKICETAVSAFVFDADAKELLEGVNLYKESALFSENTYFYEDGRFSLSFFNADIGSTLTIEI